MKRIWVKLFRNDLVLLFSSWRNITSEVQMIMTFQNPLDWASEMFYDSENEKLELSKDPEIILKTYFNLIEYFLRGCEIINKKFGKFCFMTRIEDILANPRKFSKFCYSIIIKAPSERLRQQKLTFATDIRVEIPLRTVPWNQFWKF